MILKPNSACSVCGGRGFVESPEGPHGCGCLRQDADGANLSGVRGLRTEEGALLPPGEFGLADLSLPTEETRRVAAFLQRWVREFRCDRAAPSILLLGRPGTGKTTLAVAALNDLRRRGHWVRRWSEPDETALLLSSSHRLQERGEANLEDATRTTSVLLIDDLGAGFSPRRADDWRSILFRLIDAASRAMLPLVVTANAATEGDLEELLGPRSLSRLLENALPWALEEHDFRRSGVRAAHLEEEVV